MTEKEYLIRQFDGAVMLLPHELRAAYRQLPGSMRAQCEEIRLRVGTRPAALLPEGETDLNFRELTPGDMEATLTVATNASFHTVKDSLKKGFVTVSGGYRIGLGGNVITREGEITGFRAVSSLCIRIPRQLSVADEALMQKVFPGGGLCSVLIVSPPGLGKTTLLRELIRLQSNAGRRVCVVDERNEIAAMASGVPQMDVGRRTDVLEGCRKADGALMMLRALNPEVVALDEITAPEDVAAIETIANCGVHIFATVHGEEVRKLEEKELFRRVKKLGIFRRVVHICRGNGKRQYTVREWEGEQC